jgi:hypothetical protein
LSNIMLHELDRELEKRGHLFVRYADDSVPWGCTRDGRAVYKQWPPEIDVQALVSNHLKLHW